MTISPTTIIDPSAQLAEDVVVEPFVIIEAGVTVGARTHLRTGTVLHTGSVIGADCQLGPYAVVAGAPMDTRFKGEPSLAVLEDGVILREFATVHRATGEGQATRIGAHTLMMSYAHASHNAAVGQHVVLTTQVQLGGHSSVGDYATLGANAMVHQFGCVGAYAILGALSAANRDILPYTMAHGFPARHYRLNKVGLQRRGITAERYRVLEHAIRAYRHRDWETLESLAATHPDVRVILDFKTSSKRGVSSFA
jgi:UDP-N-acetylglucosamine acyltransferase